MSGPPFWNTRIGVRFFEHTMPELVRQLTRLNDLIERFVRQVELDRDLVGGANTPASASASAQEPEDA